MCIQEKSYAGLKNGAIRVVSKYKSARHERNEIKMIRFVMPSASLSKELRIRHLNNQFEEFLNSDVLRQYLDILGVHSTDPSDIHAELQQYNTRQTKNGGILESQDAPKHLVLEEKKTELFPYYKEMGLVTINTPQIDSYDRIVVLGGSANSNFDKTKTVSRFLNQNVKDVSALACYRPIPPGDRNKTRENHNASDFDTEAGSFVSAFNKEFNLQEDLDKEVFHFERNINTAYGIRVFNNKSGTRFRVLAAPGENPTQRPNTYDTCLWYMDDIADNEAAKILVITNNQYSNFQFLGFSMAILERNRNSVDFDIIGCSPDNKLTDEEHYDSNQYFGDIRNTIDWIVKFRNRFVNPEM